MSVCFGAFLGEFHDLLAAFLARHADGVNVTEFAVCAARPAFRGSDTGLASDTVNSRVTDTEQSGDATVGDFTWGEACDQVGTLLAGHTDLLGGEVVRAILDPTLHALRISERDPDMAVKSFFHRVHQIVLGFGSMQNLDFDVFGGLTSLLLGVIGLTRSKRMRCPLIILEVSGESGNRVGLDQVGIIDVIQNFGVHDFGGDCRRVFLILGFIRCGGCGIIRH